MTPHATHSFTSFTIEKPMIPMKRIMTVALLPVLGMLPLSQSQASTTPLSVTGQLLPGTCQLQLDRVALDYGTINRRVLARDNFNTLEPQRINLDIRCNQPSRFAVSLRSGWSGILDSYLVGFLGSGSARLNNLTDEGGNTVGGYTVGFVPEQQMADGAPVSVISRAGYQDIWEADTEDIHVDPALDGQYSWSAGALVPQPIRHLTSQLKVRSALLPLSQLPNGADEFTVKGGATLTLRYL
jgi:hypothetical protein